MLILGIPGDRFGLVSGGGRLALQVRRLTSREAITPGRLDQHPPGMLVARQRKATLAPPSSTRMFTRHQAKVGHELPGGFESADVIQFRKQDHRRGRLATGPGVHHP